MITHWYVINNDWPDVTTKPISAIRRGRTRKRLTGGEPPTHVVDVVQRAVEAELKGQAVARTINPEAKVVR